MALTDAQIDDMASMMRDGARRICDEVISKWNNPNYHRGLENMIGERYSYFATIRANVPGKLTLRQCSVVRRNRRHHDD